MVELYIVSDVATFAEDIMTKQFKATIKDNFKNRLERYVSDFIDRKARDVAQELLDKTAHDVISEITTVAKE